MLNLKNYCLLIIFTLLLTGCTGKEEEKLSIKPYSLSEDESLLISKTGVNLIDFFKLKGALKEDEDLQFSVDVFEKGKFKEELLTTWTGPEGKFKNSLISFGVSDLNNEEQSIELILGLPDGLAETSYPNHMTASSFSSLIDKKIILEKNKPVYLTAWLGTTKNSLHSPSSQNGELPEEIKKAELSFLYKVVWTDKEGK